jgi:hypothetical protein
MLFFDSLMALLRRRVAESLLGGIEDAVLAVDRQVERNRGEIEVSKGVTLLLEAPKKKARQ